MKWIKKGLLFNSPGKKSWALTHAAVPLTKKVADDIFRIYFSMRDKQNRASAAYIEVNITDPQKILYLTENPILSPGELGTFDDNGVTASSLVDYQEQTFLYYIGWNAGGNVLYHTSIGLAISNDGGKSFQKYSKGPIMDRTTSEPYFCSNPFVLIDKGTWKMWYISFVKWIIDEGKTKPYYHIKYAESEDGINWKREGIVCIDFKNDKEWAISRPCVIKENNLYKMWYSFCGELSYRIGYAESSNGVDWKRRDNVVGIDVSSNGWDSEMIEFPYVFDNKNTRYMLYCGNGFGKTGFGYAILDK